MGCLPNSGLSAWLRSRTAVLSETEEILNQVIELVRRDRAGGKSGHDAEPGSNLCFNQEAGSRLIIQSRTEAAFAAGMAHIAVLHEDHFAPFHVGIGWGNRADDWFAPAAGAAAKNGH